MDLPFFSRPRATWHAPAWHDPEATGEVLTAYEIYQRIRCGHGTTTLDAARSASTNLAERYDQRTTQVRDLRQKMDAAWQGGASDSAQSELQPLVRAFQDAHLSLEASKTAVDGQIRAFCEAFRKVEDIPAQAPTSSLVDDINPFAADIDRAIIDYTHKASKNVAVYQSYSTQSADNGARMPIPYPLIEPDTVLYAAVQQSSRHTTTRQPEPDTINSPPRATALGTDKSDQPPLTPHLANQPDQQISVPQQSPDRATTPAYSATVDITPGLSAAPASDSGQRQHAPSGTPATGAGGGYVFGPAPARPDTTIDRPDPVSDRKALGGRSTGSGVPGQRGIRSRRPDAGLRAGLRGAEAYRPTAGDVTASSTGGAGYGDGMLWGAGASRGTGGDGVHQRKYPLTPDPHSLFGSDIVVPPAVIGADDDSDWGED